MKQIMFSAALTLLLGSHLQAAAPDAAITDSLEVFTATVETLPYNHVLDGSVEAVHQSTIAAQTGGQIEEIFFDVDDFVTKDDIILQLKDTEQRTALEQASAQLRQAESDRERIAAVVEKGAATQAELDLVENRLTTAKAAFERAQEQLDYTVVKAPYTGIVTERHVQLGEVASPGKPLMSGISLEELRVIVDVPQSLVSFVREYQKAYIYPRNGDLIEALEITIFPYADMRTNTFKVRLDLPKKDTGLFPGMFVKVGFFAGTRELLTVPSVAIVYRSEVTGLYTLSENGKIRFRHVRAGEVIGDRTVILSGLEPGEQVALDPVKAGVQARAALNRKY